MNSDSSQQTFDIRNLVFALGGVASILVFLVILLEKNSLKVKPVEEVVIQPPEKQEILTITPVYPKTTVNIQPLVTQFPPLPDFTAYSRADQRKAAFIDYLSPIIQYQNEKILRDRRRLEYISKYIINGYSISEDEQIWLQQLADKYEVAWQENVINVVLIKLARRVDIIPLSLAVVQAAKESSWGRSRYAIQANNLFGQWCYDVGCGVVPGKRTPGARHEVRRFTTVNDAARSYIHNLNTHPRYSALRYIRQQLRSQNKEVTGSALANGLLFYSERRQAYVDEVIEMIYQYKSFQKRRTG